MEFFADKIVIITGGASGIGRALSEELARRKANVILADVNTELLEETTKSITEAGGKAKAATLDVTDHEAVKKLVDDTVSKHGRLDYIFNNAGIVVLGETRDNSYDDFKRVLDVNIYGVANGVMAAYPVMVKQGFGHIVNTASLAGLVPVPESVSYTTTKFAVVGLSNSLRTEGADLGVKVSVVCPGLIKTPIYYSKTVKLDQDKMLEDVFEAMPPEKCASVILRGVKRNKAIITVTLLAKPLWLLHRISPGLTLWLAKLLMRRLRKDLRIED